MSNNDRCYHVKRGYSLRYKQVVNKVRDGMLKWVIEGQTFRDIGLDESIAFLNERAKLAEPMASVEVPGLKFRDPAYVAHRDSGFMACEATQAGKGNYCFLETHQA